MITAHVQWASGDGNSRQRLECVRFTAAFGFANPAKRSFLCGGTFQSGAEDAAVQTLARDFIAGDAGRNRFLSQVAPPRL
jgi:hypothetical protein